MRSVHGRRHRKGTKIGRSLAFRDPFALALALPRAALGKEAAFTYHRTDELAEDEGGWEDSISPLAGQTVSALGPVFRCNRLESFSSIGVTQTVLMSISRSRVAGAMYMFHQIDVTFIPHNLHEPDHLSSTACHDAAHVGWQYVVARTSHLGEI